MMKRSLMILLGALLALMLAGCNETAKQVDQKTEGKKEVTEGKKESTSELTLQEVFDKALDVQEKVTGFETIIEMNQKITMNEETIDMKSDIEAKVVTDPLTMHQKMTMDVGNGEKFEVDSYFTSDGLYMFEPMEKVWIKLPKEFSDQMNQLNTEQSNPAEQLKQFTSFINDFEFEQDDSNYILTLKASGEKFDEFIKERVKSTMPDDMPLSEQIFDSMTFDHVEYVMKIDKETFHLQQLDVAIDSTTKIEAETMHLQQEMKSVYSQYNEVDKITVPAEVIENAQEIDFGSLDIKQ